MMSDPGKGFVFKATPFLFSFFFFGLFVCFPRHRDRIAVTKTSVLKKTNKTKKTKQNKADKTVAGKSGTGGRDEFDSRVQTGKTACTSHFLSNTLLNNKFSWSSAVCALITAWRFVALWTRREERRVLPVLSPVFHGASSSHDDGRTWCAGRKLFRVLLRD